MAENEGFVTYALWGTGELAAENAKALLEEYIPDNVGTVYRPERVTREQKGLRTALDWFESPDFLGAGGAVPSTDLVQSLLDDLENNGDEVFLLALWPEKPSHEDFDFIESVQNNGITVFDLSRALDELDLSLYSRPEPTKEEKAEAKAEAAAEKRGRGRPRKKLSDEAEVTTEEVINNEGAFVMERPKVELVEDPKPVLQIPNIEIAVDAETRLAEAAMDVLGAIDKYIEAKVAAVLATRGITISVEVPGEDDRPPFDPPYVGVDTSPYFKSKDGTVRPAPAGTKPRRGELLVNLTAEEVSAL